MHAAMITLPSWRLLLAGILFVALAPLAPAQGLGQFFQSKGAQEEVQLRDVLERSITAFERTARQKLEDLGLEAPTETEERETKLERHKIVSDAVSDYETRARRALTELELDGILTLDESTAALGQLTEESLLTLEGALSAIADGHAAPPMARDSAGWFEHARALTDYTINERNEPRAWLALGGSILVGLLVGLTFLGLIGKMIGKRRSSIGGTFLEALRSPVFIGIVVATLQFGLTFVWLPAGARDFLDLAIKIVLAGGLFWFLWKMSGGLSEMTTTIARRAMGDIDEDVADLLTKAFRVFALAVFAFLVAEVFFGVDFGAFIAGFGVLGLLLTFTLRDVIRNFAASFTIHSARPFQLGSLVQFRDWTGHIETVGFRCSQIRTLSGHLVTIPNVMLTDEPVENLSARPYVRRQFKIGLTHDSGSDGVKRACEIIREVVEDAEWAKPGFESHVVFEEIGDYALEILVDYRFDGSDYWDAKANDTKVNLAIMERIEEEPGIEMAFPTRTLHIDQLDDEADSSQESGEEKAMAESAS
jgi:MscS family membrane protein